MKYVKGWWCPDYDDNLDHPKAIRPAPSFAGRNTYTLDYFLQCLPLIKDFRHALDIGGHVGLWSWPMSRCFAKVTAFEPIPEHVECFQRNLRGVDNVTLMQAALGAESGVVDMAIKPPWSLKARVRTKEPGSPIAVNAEMLDTMVEPVGIDFIKIDCEGYELRVIEGGEKTIKACRPLVLVEQKPLNTGRYGFGIKAVELLQSWGAVVHWERGGDYCVGWA